MSEELAQGVRFEFEYFSPSHLTKALIASGIAVGFGLYAMRQFSLVEKEEVVAMVTGG